MKRMGKKGITTLTILAVIMILSVGGIIGLIGLVGVFQGETQQKIINTLKSDELTPPKNFEIIFLSCDSKGYGLEFYIKNTGFGNISQTANINILKTLLSTGEKTFHKATLNKILETLTISDKIIAYTNLGYLKKDENFAEIKTISDLNKIRNKTNGSYVLKNDLDLKDLNFIPIKQFSGIFDGNGNEIKNLNIKIDEDNIGFFSTCEKCNIRNLILTNVKIFGKNNVGGVVGEVNGVISNSFVSGEIFGKNNVGGVVGLLNQGFMNKLHSDVLINASKNVGGIVGSCETRLTNSHNSGEIIGITNIGGIVGFQNKNCELNELTNFGTVQGFNNVGGIIGTSSSTLKNSLNYGIVKGNKNIGGVIGLLKTNGAIESYYDSNITNLTETGKGIPKTSFELKIVQNEDQTIYENWNKFDWNFKQNQYPKLLDLYKHSKGSPFIKGEAYLIEFELSENSKTSKKCVSK